MMENLRIGYVKETFRRQNLSAKVMVPENRITRALGERRGGGEPKPLCDRSLVTRRVFTVCRRTVLASSNGFAGKQKLSTCFQATGFSVRRFL